MGVYKGTFLGRLVTSLYVFHSWACVHYGWPCVSLEDKVHLGGHLVVTPTNSFIILINIKNKEIAINSKISGIVEFQKIVLLN